LKNINLDYLSNFLISLFLVERKFFTPKLILFFPDMLKNFILLKNILKYATYDNFFDYKNDFITLMIQSWKFSFSRLGNLWETLRLVFQQLRFSSTFFWRSLVKEKALENPQKKESQQNTLNIWFLTLIEFCQNLELIIK